jgi:hypothetical protein
MRLPPAVIPAVAVGLAILAGVASAGPRDPELGRLATDGSLTLASDRPGVALLTVDRFKPGDSVSGNVSLTNEGDMTGALALGVTDLVDRPGPYGGRLSRVLRLRVEDVSGARAPLETAIDRAPALALGRLDARETRAYRVTATFPDSGPFASDNLQQGSSLELALTWRLSAPAPPVATPSPAAPAPPVAAPPAVPPTAAPAPALLRLRVPRQRLLRSRRLIAYATCEVACRVRFSARTDTAPGAGRPRRTLQRTRVLRGARRWRTLRAGEERRIVLALRPRARRRLTRRLHTHGRVGITVVARMRSAAGSRTARRRIVLRSATARRG